MGYQYDKAHDRFVGHDYPGLHGNGFIGYEHDEMELGARVAIMLDDPDQWWWEIYRDEIEADLNKETEYEPAGTAPGANVPGHGPGHGV